MLIAQLGHIGEDACLRWLDTTEPADERARQAARADEFLTLSLTRRGIDEILDAVDRVARGAPRRISFDDGTAPPPASDLNRAWRPKHTRGSTSSRPNALAKGKAARKVAPRSSHGAWEAAVDRPDPVALLQEQDETRVPELVPIRYGRMLESPFAFFRGGALIMASDLAASPRTGFTVQLCGDAHLSNFGMFASPERHLLFDINDFDETLPGPWEWDVKRLAASLEVCGRDLGFAPADRRDVVMAGVQGYRETMLGAARMGALEAWYEHIRVADLMAWMQTQVGDEQVGRKEVEQTAREVAKARTRDSTRVLTRLADEIDGRLRFVPDPPLIVPLDDMLPPGTAHDEIAGVDGIAHRHVPAIHLPTPSPDRGVPLHGHGSQGRRRRQRGHPCVGHPVHRARRR